MGFDSVVRFSFVFVTIFIASVCCDDSGVLGSSSGTQAFVISTTTDVPSFTSTVGPDAETPIASGDVTAKPGIPLKPEIYSFHIDSDIRYRYSRTYVTSRVVNRDANQSQEVTFRVVLPETAFISKFIMEIDGKSYEAYVKEKEEAKRVYNQAQSQGQSAGLVELNTRNANVFDVNVNIKAQAKVNFNLTYEELLSRRLGRYEQSISITPDQITNVKDFQIVVNIEESQNITLLKVPNLRNDIEAQEDSEGNNKDAIIERPAGNKAQIKWSPTEQDQSQLAKQGITGKFIVQYDIKRELDAGEVLVMNGYFVHFFAPANLPALRKHVVFILDTSGSMWGRKMTQLKEAMSKILADLNSEDFFNIFTFSGEVSLWSPEDTSPTSPNSNWAPPPFHGESLLTPKPEDPRKRQPFAATPENIEKAQKFIQSLVASGGTNIQDAIVQALNLTAAIKLARDGEVKENSTTTTTTESPSNTTTNSTAISTPLTVLPPNVESLIIFLTDGEPTVGVTDLTQIQTSIQAENKNISVPLFSLAFGEGADFPFVRKLSLQNNGFARKIYEAADAAIQLKGFYNEIASPLLSNVTFNYTSPDYSIQNLTLTKFATVFGGTEIAVAGIIVPNDEATTTEAPEVPTTVQTLSSGEPLEEVQIEGNQVAPTEKRYFDVVIGGFGRHGHVHFNDPEIFSSPIPWGVPVIKPFPPRPTPAPTQEDVFLERLWAYLTVQQLIEKDLAKQTEENTISDEIKPTPATTAATPTAVLSTIVIGNKTIIVNTTVVSETPKQKALRLALKYGFVTSLTSLVVVKPNSSDVTNAVEANSKPDVADSISAPQSFNFQAAVKLSAPRPSFTANRIIGGSLPLAFPAPHIIGGNFAAGGGFGGLPGHGHFGVPSHTFSHRPVYATSTRPFITHSQFSTSTAYEEEEDISPGGYTTAPIPTTTISAITSQSQATSLPTTATTEFEVSSTPGLEEIQSASTSEPEIMSTIPPVSLTLDDLTWYKESISVTINGSEVLHQIAVNATSDDTAGFECGDEKSGHKGHCVHLKDCLIPSILDDYQLYIGSYFCSITSRSNGEFYAGTCCATKPRHNLEEEI